MGALRGFVNISLVGFPTWVSGMMSCSLEFFVAYLVG